MKKALIKSGLFLAIAIVLFSCDSTLKPQEDRISNLYSIYGSLDISKAENAIRIHDNRVPLLESPSQVLDLDVTLMDISNGEVVPMTDRIISFDGVNTHNFTSDALIKYDNIYQVKLDNRDGYRDSISVKTPRQADVSVIIPQVRCDGIVIDIIFDPLDYEAGEFLEFRVEFEHLGNTFGTSQTYMQSLVTDSGKAVVKLGVEHTINKGLGTLWFGYESCKDLKINEFVLYYTYFGAELEPPEVILGGGDESFGKRVLGAYSGRMNITISDSLYRDELWDL